MKQVIRRGLKEIIVDEVADPVVSRNIYWFARFTR